jgi:hypothetical protein
VYLAAVWLASLEAVAEMAAARGDEGLAREATALARRGRETLNSRYWLPAEGHHAFGLLRGGGTNPALTVWPATAASFGLLDAAPARRTLSSIATPAMTADWGVRMLAADHPLYAPTHYNMGAVWPFVSGFAAWAHYRYERPWAGFPLVDALARMAFDWARGRHPELMSGAFYRPLDTAVPQQFFATSMLVTPVMSGLLGWEPDAPHGRARLAPALPPAWDRVTVERLRCGASRLDVTLEQEPGALIVRLSAAGPQLTVDLAPQVPPGARDVRAGAADASAGPVRVTVGAQPVTVKVTWRGGLVPAPVLADLQPGQSSTGARITDFAREGEAWRIDVAGVPGRSVEVDLHGVPVRPEGADVVERRNHVTRVRIVLPDGPGAWTTRRVWLAEE